MASQAKREDNAVQEAKAKISAGEISGLSIENFENASKPLTYTYDIRVPGYAQKTGKRLFLQPGFFEYGAEPAFSASSRTYPVYFSYPWSEQDIIEIELPKGFDLDNADAPADISDPSSIGSLKITIGIDRASRTLKYNRTFFFGANGKIYFPATVYEPLKQLFSAFHKADTHTITLKQAQ